MPRSRRSISPRSCRTGHVGRRPRRRLRTDRRPVSCRAEGHRRHDPGHGAVLRCARPHLHRRTGSGRSDAQPSTPSSPRLDSVLAWAIAKIMAGLVAVYRGKFPDVISSIEQALAAQAAEGPLPWQLPARVLLAKAYAALGRTDEAERVLADAKEHTGQFVALHSPQLTIAKSWLAAAKGLERRALELARAAADAAHQSGSVRRRSRGTAPCGTIRRPHRRGATGGTRRTRQRTPGAAFRPATRQRSPPLTAEPLMR